MSDELYHFFYKTAKKVQKVFKKSFQHFLMPQWNVELNYNEDNFGDRATRNLLRSMFSNNMNHVEITYCTNSTETFAKASRLPNELGDQRTAITMVLGRRSEDR